MTRKSKTKYSTLLKDAIKISIISVWLAVMISSAGFFALNPKFAQLTQSLTCPDGTMEIPKQDSRYMEFYCIKGDEIVAINPFKLIGSGTLIYSLLGFPIIWVMYWLIYARKRKNY